MTTRTVSRTMDLDRRQSILRFAPGEGGPPDGRYTMRGGICWPIVTDPATNQMEGFALMAGRHEPTGVVYVVAQRPFVTIDHVQDADGRIRHEGLSTWFVDCWAQWFADLYCWRQPWETNCRHLKQVLDSPMVQPKPHFVELDWADDADARLIVHETEAEDRLVYERESPLHRAIMEYSVADPADRGRFPAVHALTCALYGMTWVPREKGPR